ncbi:MAG: hypothetical protein ACO27F_13070 [Beijerinckiaceae bacterium]|jgi:hypothetical protein
MMTSDLSRITTEYSEVEDRILLLGEDKDGSRVELWLTQRLLTRIVPVLASRLEEGAAESPAADLLNAFEQERANAVIKPAPRVPREGASVSLLVESVDVTFGGAGVRLVFKDGAGVARGMTFTTLVLRQWLSILHAATRAAGWPSDVWPHWMSREPAPQQPNAPLH